MDLGNFTYITGLASIFGFIAQIMDWFPDHKEIRKNIFILLIGVFLGSLSGIFNTSTISFDFSVSGFSLLLTTIGFIVAFILLAAVLCTDSNKREELYAVSGVATGVFVLVLFFGGMSSLENESENIRNEKSRLSVNELIIISDEATTKGDFDRALMHLETIKVRLPSNDIRREKIEARIEEIKGMQI